ncbi:uncharacterized protein FOBCDRAFT_138637 [Fusarium oxysporum Fo47]|uniref:uncharacterized protein n=1 Tax=Fusarium oxysporum Fo47 TaxID=660027 RepID=UPI002869AD14|nr:uncharacterized protein FOBCDRAFT_138637 [Fusarium oxysporum Fo47]QKD57221.2 hypothetical protein FOBCDRAFT_138637 [Fusarium oxysporum Fo47]
MGFPAQLYLAWRRRFQRCAATCTEAVAERVGSKTTDLGCRCSDLGSAAAKMTPCIALKGDCDFDGVPKYRTNLFASCRRYRSNCKFATNSIRVHKTCNRQKEWGFEDSV